MKTIFHCLSLALVLLLTTPVFAGTQDISKQQAMNIATDAYPGRVLSVKREQNVYRVKTLSDDGRIRVVIIEASSGKIISGK